MASKFSGEACPILHTIDDSWLLSGRRSLRDTTIVDVDLTEVTIDWSKVTIDATTLFIGCQLPLETEIGLRRRGANFLHSPEGLTFRPLRRNLYTYQELMRQIGETPEETVDLAIYHSFRASRDCPNINVALWQRLHDFSIDEGLRRLLDFSPEGLPRRKVVGFMGGHGTGRDTEEYRTSLRTAKLLAEAGFFVASGGGPGIMEAANLGAYLAGKTEEQVLEVFDILATAPKYTDDGFQEAAFRILDLYPTGTESLAIPTWFYGHEPSNLFATYIAKYFSNSIREDTLLAIALYGIVYAAGSAGTTQEIFMDAAQNHYATFDYVSPMVFLGRKRYAEDTRLYPTLTELAAGRDYADFLHLTDEPADVIRFIKEHPPRLIS